MKYFPRISSEENSPEADDQKILTREKIDNAKLKDKNRESKI